MSCKKAPIGRYGVVCLLMFLGAFGCGMTAVRADAQAVTSHSFIERLGRDTLALETIVEGEGLRRSLLVTMSPVVRVVRSETRLDESAGSIRFRVEEGHLVEGRLRFEFTDETVLSTDSLVLTTDTSRIGIARPPGRVVPALNRIPMTPGTLEELARAAAASPTTASPLRIFASPVGQLVPIDIDAVGGGVYALQFSPGTRVLIELGDNGRMRGADARETTVGTVVEEFQPVEPLESLGARHLRRGGLGTLSPRDSVTVALGGGRSVTVDYGRPSRRGRSVWGALVPYGGVWRTGANLATHVRIEGGDVVIGTTTIKPGNYTLWSVLDSEAGGWLIVNTQTGQWGTVYDPARDLVRIPLRAVPVPSAVETFRIDIRAGADGRHVTMCLTWGERAYCSGGPAGDAKTGHVS